MNYKYTLTPHGRWTWEWEVEEIRERPYTMNCRGMRGRKFGKERARTAAIRKIRVLQAYEQDIDIRLRLRETYEV